MLAALTAAIVASAAQQPRYTATTTVVVGAPGDDAISPQADDPERRMLNAAALFRSPAVLSAASADIGGEVSPGELADLVRVDVSRPASVISVSATAGSPRFAADLANALPSAYERVVRDELAGGAPPIETTVDRATLPSAPSEPQTERNAALGALFGLMISSVAAWRLAERDAPITQRMNVEGALGAPSLAHIPETRALARGVPALMSAPDSRARSEYDMASSAVAVLAGRGRGMSVVITSPRRKEGRTSVALNLAVAAANNGYTTTLVDADLETRRLSRLAYSGHRAGVAELSALDRGPGKEPDAYESGWHELLSVVPAGRRTHSGPVLFHGKRFRAALDNLKERADLMLIDGPPLLDQPRGIELAAAVDAVIVVVSRDVTVDDVRESAERLRAIETPILGYVYNGIRRRSRRRRRPFAQRRRASRSLAGVEGAEAISR